MDYEEKSDAGTRRQPFSLSQIFHQKRNRASCIPDPAEEPTCQEKVHYPVFNPRDPRHNPEASIFPWRRQESSTSSSESQPNRSITWVHSLSRRSFHRARSGLLAFRAGVLRRSTVEGEEFEIGSNSPISVSPVNPRREIQAQFHSSGTYSSSTQEDLGFGIEMYRMSAPPSSPISDTRLESTFPLTNDTFVPEAPRSPRTLSAIIGHQIRPFIHAASASEAENSTGYTRTHDHVSSQFSQGSQADAGVTTSNNRSDSHVAHIATETTDHNVMESPWGVSLPAAPEDVDFTDPQSVWAEHRTGDAQQSTPFTSLTERESQMCPESSCNRNSEQDQQRVSKTCDSSASSEMTPKSHGSHDITDIADDEISESSADVLFAFPGIYREMLEQWARERQDETPQVPQVNEQPPCIVLQDAPYSDPPSYQESEEFYAFGGPTIGMDRSELPEIQWISPDLLNSDEEQPLFSPTSPDSEMSDGYLEEASSCSEIPEAHDPMPEDEYSSDPHMSLLPHVEQPQSQIDFRDYGTFCFAHQAPAHQEQTSIAYPGRDTFECPHSNYENLLSTPEATTSPEITSTEMTSMTSASTEIWSPVDSDLLLTSPVTDQNEYFLADGKTSSQYPDRGNQPIKLRDGSTDSPDLGASQMAQGLHELISPEMLSLQFVPGGVPYEMMDFEDEFTDDEFYPGICVAPSQFH